MLCSIAAQAFSDDSGTGATGSGAAAGGGSGGGASRATGIGGGAGGQAQGGGEAQGGGGGEAQGGGVGEAQGGGGGGGGGPDPVCVAMGVTLQNAIVTHYNNPPKKLGGASVAVIRGSCRWVSAVGEAHTGAPMTPAHLLRVASVTKTYVAATLLALVDEGKVALDDTLDKYVPLVPGGTLRMLLRHPSGLYDYTTDMAFWQQALAQQPKIYVTPKSLVDVALAHPANFAPDQGWAYSNTGFILAGMVIEAVTKTTASVAIRKRTFDVAGLKETFFDGEEVLPTKLATGFGDVGQDLTNALHPSVNWSAGGVVATAGNVADWAAAHYGGKVLTANALAEMLLPVATGEAGLSSGLGAFLYEASKIGNVSPAIGHGGKLPGYRTNMLYLKKDDTVIVQIGMPTTARPTPAR